MLALPLNPGLRKSSSGNSLTSTLNSEAVSETSTAATEISEQVRKSQVSSEEVSPSSDAASLKESKDKDRGLHNQIEDLLTALGEMQKQQGDLMLELQQEREEREEDRKVGLDLLTSLQSHATAVREMIGDDDASEEEVGTRELISRASDTFGASGNKKNLHPANKAPATRHSNGMEGQTRRRGCSLPRAYEAARSTRERASRLEQPAERCEKASSG